MQTNQLKRIHPNKKRMIVARGGKRGKTAGRGGKGQSARAGNKRRPEWRDIIKRLPKLRGRGVNSFKSIQTKPAVINVGVLSEVFNSGEAITPTILIERGVISLSSGVTPIIKILGDGEITKSLKVSGCYISGSAKIKIEKAGGTVTLVDAQIKAEKQLASDTTAAVAARETMTKKSDASDKASAQAATKAAAAPKSSAKAPGTKTKEEKPVKKEGKASAKK